MPTLNQATVRPDLTDYSQVSPSNNTGSPTSIPSISLAGTDSDIMIRTPLPAINVCADNLRQFYRQGVPQYRVTPVQNQRISSNPLSGTSSDRPSNPATGTLFFDASLGYTITWNGSSWVNSVGKSI